MTPVKAFLAIQPVTENDRYKRRYEGRSRIPVTVNQVDYNGGGDSRLFRCVLPGEDGFGGDNILWVPLDAIRDENNRPLKLE